MVCQDHTDRRPGLDMACRSTPNLSILHGVCPMSSRFPSGLPLLQFRSSTRKGGFAPYFHLGRHADGITLARDGCLRNIQKILNEL